MITRRDALKLGAGAAGIAMAGGAALLWRANDEGETPAETPPASSPPVAHDDALPAATASPDANTSVQAVVTEAGFDIRLGPVHVYAPAGVAAVGTVVSVTRLSRETPAEYRDFSTVVGQPVGITLGDGGQPEQPITVVFDLAGWEDVTADVSEGAPLVVMGRSEAEEDLLLFDAVWDEQGQTLTAAVDHLTEIFGYKIDLQGFVTNLLLDLVEARFPKPERAYAPLTIGAATYSVAQSNNLAVWPVVTNRRGQVAVELHSNSPLPWAVQTTPSVVGSVSGHYSDRNVGVAAYYQGLHGIFGNERTAVMPGTVATFQFSTSAPPTSIDLKIDQPLFIVTALLWIFESMLQVIVSGPKAQALLATYEGLGCIINIVKTPDQIEENQNFTGLVRSAASCIGTLVEEKAGTLGSRFFVRTIAVVAGLIISGAAVIAAAAANVLLTVTGNDRFTLAFHATSGATSAVTTTDEGPSLDQPIAVRWTLEQYGPRFAPPAIVNGVMYYGRQMSLQAHSLATGELLWTNSKIGSEVWATPAVADGVLYVSSYFDHVTQTTAHMQALDAPTGDTLWQVMVRARALFAPMYGGGMVFAESYESDRYYLYAFAADTGEVRWKTSKGGHGVAYADGVLYTADVDMTLYALDAATGDEHWQARIGSGVMSPIFAEGVVYAGGRTSTLCAIDPQTQEMLWQYDPEESLLPPPQIVDDRVFIRSASTLHVLDRESGSELWEFTAISELEFFDDCRVAGDVVYLTSGDRLYVLDAVSGRELWRFGLGDSMISRRSVAVGGGMVVVGSGSTGLTALGNVGPTALGQDVTLRGAPSNSGVERGSARAGDAIDHVGARDTRSEVPWVEVTIEGTTGWIPVDAIDPATMRPEGETEYVYVP